MIRNTNAQSASFQGLPTGSAIGILFAALFTGALLSMYFGFIGWPLLLCFIVATLVVTTLVNPKGLFLTVASAPILFFLAVLATGYAISGDELSGGGASSKAALLAVVYPITEVFPVLATVTVGAIIIAVARYKLVERQNKARARTETAERHQVAVSNRRAASQSRRARERSSSVSVQELLSRAKDERERSPKPNRSTRQQGKLSDNLYD